MDQVKGPLDQYILQFCQSDFVAQSTFGHTGNISELCNHFNINNTSITSVRIYLLFRLLCVTFKNT